MELIEGSQFGHYTIVEHLGTGGMGTVYRATDSKLGRQVALKLLRPELVEDSAALARLEREARMLASLNHPQIATIYSFEEHDGARLLALEYVSGPTLAERLRRGPLPVHQAISVGRQIAQALEAAHAKGIMHRDLKPANIKVSEQGQVKVLDFGLAKMVPRSSGSEPEASTATLEVNLTQKATLVGTPAYMSPEQARGEELDARTDVWSFGCVLYEALTGKVAFGAKTFMEIMVAVAQRDPDWAALPAAAPASLRALLKRCLRRERENRVHSIADARLELEDLLAGPAEEAADSAPGALTRRTALTALTGAAAGAAAVGVFAISRYRGAVPRNLTRFAIETPEGRFHTPSYNKRVAISPDGSVIASGTAGADGTSAAHLRWIKELEWRPIKEIPVAPNSFPGAVLFGRWPLGGVFSDHLYRGSSCAPQGPREWRPSGGHLPETEQLLRGDLGG
jgi:tRNA A-37 threonylcarbamoyl transferase component Bud32